MNILRGFCHPQDYRGGYVAIGNFDGVHRGHRRIAERLVELARQEGRPAVVFTFDPPPVELLRPGQVPPRLSTLETKAELIAEAGVDSLIVYPTDHALLNLTPAEFFESIVRGELQGRGMVEGPNFFFGHNRAGNVETLRMLCEAAGMSLEVIPPMHRGSRMVSSSEVRRLIESGDVDTAVDLLGHPYRVTGRVGQGAARGRTLGFPTANLECIPTLLPCDGVYAGVARNLDRPYSAAVNVGPSPTFGETQRRFEAHLIGFDGDLYGRELKIDLIARVRPTQKFSGPDALREQLARDVARVAELVHLARVL